MVCVLAFCGGDSSERGRRFIQWTTFSAPSVSVGDC